MNSRAILLVAILALGACDQRDKAEMPPPAPYDAQATAHFCGMTLAEHAGPKGQIWIADQAGPYWFTSIHDTIAFTLLAEEPKAIRAIYVNDMAKAPSWAQAELGGWIDAEKAYFVVDSGAQGGMGSAEEVPFSDRDAATAYARQHGGRVVTFNDIPRDHILGEPVAATPSGTRK